jgi:hypothetical protein
MISPTQRFSVISIDEEYEIASSQYKQAYERFSYVEKSQAAKEDLKNMNLACQNESTSPFTYGEIPFETVVEILACLGTHGLSSEDAGTFFDIGSGAGSVVIAVGSQRRFNFQQIQGIELLPSLHSIAMQILHTSKIRASFVNGSILDISCADWTKGNVVVCNSTCFPLTLMDDISRLATFMLPGSFFVCLTNELSPSAGFSLLEELRLEYSWGEADTFVYVKANPSKEIILKS